VEATDPPDDPTYPPDEETGESEEYILSADEVRDLANWVQDSEGEWHYLLDPDDPAR
jgi:hypothetical protein